MSYTHRIDKPAKVRLKRIDAADDCGLNRDSAAEKERELGEELDDLCELLFAAGRNGLLVVLQGRDTAGKDGAIRCLLNHTNVQSCRVVPFKAPTALELSHDFLWRVHEHVPAAGNIALFNRSHYEDVLAVRVRELAPKKVWEKRYDHINAFEKLLADAGTIVIKFCLHISRKEQEERLLEREKDPRKSWKLNVGDWQDRELWNDYTEAYEDALGRCAAPHAPWHVVPADKKWFRNVAVLEALVHTLRPYRKEWEKHLADVGKKSRAELEAFRKTRGD